MISDSDISGENAEFLDAAVARGLFPTRGAAIDYGLRLLRERHEAISRIQREAVVLPDMPNSLARDDRGHIQFVGTRISLHLVLDRLFAGETANQIHDRFPTVACQAIEEVLAYVSNHQDAARAHLDQQNAIGDLYCDLSKRGPSIETLRQRFQAMKNQPGA